MISLSSLNIVLNNLIHVQGLLILLCANCHSNCYSFHSYSILQGFIHLALQSRLPIVPMVLTGTHLAWRKGSLHVRPAPITVRYLPPISTDDWTADKIDDYIKMVHEIYVENLPESQKPIISGATRNGSRS